MSYIRVAMFIPRRKPLVFLFMLLIMTFLAYLAILAIGYIRAIYYVNNVIIGVSDGLVVSSYALSPLTSIIDSNKLNMLIGNISDIEIEYHMITISYIHDTPVLIRGVDDIDSDCIFISKELADSFELSREDIVPLYSPFTRRIVFLKLCGYSDIAFSIVHYNVSIAIRGVRPGYYSIAVIRSSNKTALGEVARILGVSDIDQRYLTRALLLLTQIGDKRVVKVYEDIAEGYLSRLGIYRDLVIYTGYSISLLVLLGSLVNGIGVVMILRRELHVFNIIGLPRHNIFLGLATMITMASLISTAIVTLLTDIRVFYEVKIFTLRLPPVIKLEDYVFVYLTMTTLSLMGVVLELRRVET